jgi:hypothetical protein
MSTSTTPHVRAPRGKSRRGTPGDPTPGALNPDLDVTAPGSEAGDVQVQPLPEGAGPDEPGDSPEAPSGPEATADPEAAVWEALGDPEQPADPGPDADATDGPGPAADATDGPDAESGDESGPDAEAGDPAPDAPADGAKPKGSGRPPKVAKQPGLCVHGCGLRVQRPQAKFVRGHDSLLAQELRAAYANGERTADQIREHAALISPKFAGKMERSIAAVDAERASEADAARARKALLTASHKVAAGSR